MCLWKSPCLGRRECEALSGEEGVVTLSGKKDVKMQR